MGAWLDGIRDMVPNLFLRAKRVTSLFSLRLNIWLVKIGNIQRIGVAPGDHYEQDPGFSII
jgi:hypothetical protein